MRFKSKALVGSLILGALVSSSPSQAAINWIWNHTGSWLAWYDYASGVTIYAPSSDYVQVFPGGELMFVETCQQSGITIDHYVIHGDSLEVSQEFLPGDTTIKPTTWGLLKSKY